MRVAPLALLASAASAVSALAQNPTGGRVSMLLPANAGDLEVLVRDAGAEHVGLPPHPHPCADGWRRPTCARFVSRAGAAATGSAEPIGTFHGNVKANNNDDAPRSALAAALASLSPDNAGDPLWPAAVQIVDLSRALTATATAAPVRAALRRAAVLESDLESFYARRLASAASQTKRSAAAAPPPGGTLLSSAASQQQHRQGTNPTAAAVDTGSLSGHMTLEEMFTFVRSLAAAHPTVVGPIAAIGCSLEKRRIWAFRVSTVAGGGAAVAGGVFEAIDGSLSAADLAAADQCAEPGTLRRGTGDLSGDGVLRVTMTGQHHSREPMSTSALLHFAAVLAAREAVDPAVRHLLATREIWIVPIVNPDGYAVNERAFPAGGGLHRKNTREHECTYSTGVDINRNYGFKWGLDEMGSSGTACSDMYRGPDPFSEPETQTVRGMLQAIRPVFNFNYHSYGNLLLYPYGYKVDTFPPPRDRFMFEEIVADMSRYNKFAIGTGWSVPGLYVTNGEADDYTYGELGIYALTSELGTNSDGFWPTRDRIIPIADTAYFMNWRLSWLIGSVYNVTAAQVTVAADGAAQLGFAVRNEGLGGSSGPVVVKIVPISGFTIVDPGPAAARGGGGGRRLAALAEDGSLTVTAASSLPARSTALAPVTVEISVPVRGSTIAFRFEVSDDSGFAFTSGSSAMVVGCTGECSGNRHCDLLTGTCICDFEWAGDDCTSKAATPDGSIAPLPEVISSSATLTRPAIMALAIAAIAALGLC